MNTFQNLLDVLDKLLSPEGCPWDREQTLLSMRAPALEEVCELIEAIDLDDAEHIKEELGDFLFNAAFLCRLAEKEGKCSLDDVIKEITEKLIRRHPHVFGQESAANTQEVLEQWDKIKKTEKGKDKRKSVLDDLPKGLPALSRAQKALKKMHKQKYYPENVSADAQTSQEAIIGQELISLVLKAQQSGVDAEQALRTTLAHHEQEFRKRC